MSLQAGVAVGLKVGALVGLRVGLKAGVLVGVRVGFLVGEAEGLEVTVAVGGSKPFREINGGMKARYMIRRETSREDSSSLLGRECSCRWCPPMMRKSQRGRGSSLNQPQCSYDYLMSRNEHK